MFGILDSLGRCREVSRVEWEGESALLELDRARSPWAIAHHRMRMEGRSRKRWCRAEARPCRTLTAGPHPVVPA